MTPRSKIPGSRFNPDDLELIRRLRRKTERGKRSRFITVKDVYEKEPWFLQHVRHYRARKNEWFYFVTREKPKTDSTRTSRKVAGFTWKSNKLTPIMDKDDVRVGFVQNLAFMVNSKATGWVMHEVLLDKPGFQEVVLCRIRFNPGKDKHNAQYAPRFEPIVVGQPEEGEGEDGLMLVENMNGLYVGVGENDVYLDAPLETFQGMEQQHQQWTGSCLGEAFSYSTTQYQQFTMQETDYLMNGGMQQHQELGSCGQLDGVQQQNQIWRQDTDPLHSFQVQVEQISPDSAQLYHQNMVPMMQGMMEHQEFDSSAQCSSLAQDHLFPTETDQGMEQQQQQWSGSLEHQQFMTHETNNLMNGSMEQHQESDSCDQLVGSQQQNQICGHDTDPLHSIQAMEQQQQQQLTGSCLGEAVSYSTAQHQQLTMQDMNYLMNGGMEQHQESGSCGQLVGSQQQNHICGHDTDPLHSFQAMEQQQGNEYSGQTFPYADQLCDHSMIEHHNFDTCTQCWSLIKNRFGGTV